jgi:1,4-dihydroxy-2-naphthoate octaprenyltransferase
VVNNLRDIPTDRFAGKNTLAVRLGERRTRALYVTMVVGALVVAALTALSRPPALLAVAAAIFAMLPLQAVVKGARGRQLIPVLVATGRFQLAFGALYAVGLWLGGRGT